MGQGQYAESYGYDWMGNVITRSVGGELRAYSYGRPPEAGQFVTPTQAHQIYIPVMALNYDASISGVEQPFAVTRVSGDGGEQFRAAYDRNGNMTLRVEISGTERVTYMQAWDVENRLSVVSNTITGEVSRFVYDGNGKRVSREDRGGLTVYFGALEVHITGTQRVTTTYYFAGGQRIAVRRDGRNPFCNVKHPPSTG